MLWLYLHFPTLQLDSLFADIEQPIAVVDGLHHHIVQVNQAAKEVGIKSGMGLASAAALCHDIQVHQYNAEIEHNKIKDIAQWLYLKTSDIALYPPQGILVRVTHMLSLYEGFHNYWQQLSEHLDELKVSYHFAFGYSMQQAQLLALSGSQSATTDEALLKQALSTLPIELTGLHSHTHLSTKTIEQLKRVGIKTIKELLALPIQELARKFDIQLVNYVGQLSGRFKTNVTFYHPPEQFSRYVELLYDIENIQWLEKPLAKLFSQLETFLLSRNLVVYELEIVLHQRDTKPQAFSVTSAAGEYRASQWAQLSKLVMESIQIESAVNGLTLKAVRQGNLESHNDDLFDSKRGQLSPLELISLLQAKLGKEKVQKITPTSDPRPEYSNRRYPAHQDGEKRNIACSDSVKLRPSFLYSEPKPLEHKCTLISGPERIVTGWWDEHSVMRDYFIAQSDEGQWLWIFKSPDKQWFVHGLFG
ncbi:Y-family DNA polymerase [Vibrio maerlii]|uniref:Y-family DNA polymerase n=1 Tax=Vibrio maerlii TaxID=2231648 RepID=UPI000E3D67F6|nr:DNA polymerase Y family protein [Vibrio maerlii]